MASWRKGLQILVVPGVLLFGGAAHAYVDETTPELESFSGYKSSYFITGLPDTKVQVSFKAQIFRNVPAYFAYTQLMIWELLIKESSPFRDINYNPEAFYRFELGTPEGTRWLDFGPLEHESNGRDGADSRSVNRVYLRYADSTHKSWQWSFKIWASYAFDRTNTDINAYRGVWEGTLSWTGWGAAAFERSDLTLRVYGGGKSYLNPVEGGQELTLRIKSRWRNFLPLFVAQFFNGHGQNLLDYRQRETAFRIGIGF